MCRFLIVKTTDAVSPEPFLTAFAAMARRSQALDGDWQGDGWGIRLFRNNAWEGHTSLAPVWEDSAVFPTLPPARIFMAHARSASFARDKGDIEFNQPYVSGQKAFVFNGLLKGVQLPYPLPGTIGAQKIWSLFLQQGQQEDTATAFSRTIDVLQQYTRAIQALNLGISDGHHVWAYTHFAAHPDYYNVRIHRSRQLAVICSEPIDGYQFVPLPQRTIVSL